MNALAKSKRLRASRLGSQLWLTALLALTLTALGGCSDAPTQSAANVEPSEVSQVDREAAAQGGAAASSEDAEPAAAAAPEQSAEQLTEAEKAAKMAESNLVRFHTTLGQIDIELDPARAPLTAANFKRLVVDGFYQGLIFHRVLANFVIQAGGHEADMSFREAPRTVVNESNNGLKNLQGTISMARTNDPDSAGAQFFINVKDNASLDPQPDRAGYTVFGQVVAGMDVVTAIELSEVEWTPISEGLPVTPIVIEHAELL